MKLLKKLMCKLFGHEWGDFHILSQDGKCTLWATGCLRCKKEKFIGAIDCAWMSLDACPEKLEAKLL